MSFFLSKSVPFLEWILLFRKWTTLRLCNLLLFAPICRAIRCAPIGREVFPFYYSIYFWVMIWEQKVYLFYGLREFVMQLLLFAPIFWQNISFFTKCPESPTYICNLISSLSLKSSGHTTVFIAFIQTNRVIIHKSWVDNRRFETQHFERIKLQTK